ncbi:TPA: type IV secretory system conjugative DNA transfer family protein [Klebsiella pneumoniae]|nr:type IV secretory system conjugative DNA transfer family protein [Klebsiella pneumoniae]
MKRLIIASLVALAATASNAQGKAQDTCQYEDATTLRNFASSTENARHEVYEKLRIPEAQYADADRYFRGKDCAHVESAISKLATLEKPLFQVIAEDTIEAQDKANQDFLNSVRRQLESGNPADVASGLDAMQGYLSRAEYDLHGKGLDACANNFGVAIRWKQAPCDPIPPILAAQQRELKRIGVTVDADTPSGIYTDLLTQYRAGTDDEKRTIQQFASSNINDILPHNILAKVAQLNAFNTAQAQTELRIREKTKAIENSQSFLGNFATIHQRILPAIGNWFGMLIAVILLAGFAVSPWANWFLFFLPHEARIRLRDKLIGSVNHIMIAFIPVQALYVIFGGWLTYLTRGHGLLSKLIFLALFVPLVVLVKRTWPNATIIPPALFRFFKSSGSKAATNNVAADGLHGSASWSDAAVAVKQGRVLPNGRVLSDSYGFALGRIDEPEAAKYDLDTRLRYMGHVLTVAPSGSGKGVGAVAPTLLEYPGSTIALDPKGELYAVTHRARNELGHKVVVIDPFGALAQLGYDVTPARLNWLDYIDPDSPDVVTQSALLADLIVVAEGRTSDNSAHFNETAKAFLRGLIVHVATLPADQRKMGELRKLLTTDSEQFDELLADMMTNDRGHGLPARAANSLLATPEKERGSILSTVRRHTDFLDDPRIAEALSVSDFDLNKLKQERMTVYVVMPPDRIELNKRFLRVMFGLAVQGVTTVPGKPEYRVLFMLDEFAQLGHMTVIEKALPIIRGFGGVFWFILQNIGQLKSNYQDGWQSFVANSGAKQFFGTSDFETAKFISETLGKTTVEYQTSNNNSGSSFGQGMSTNSGAGVSQQFTARDLLTPDEVLKLPAQKVVVMTSGKGEAPYLLDRITYYVDSAYEGRFDPNPFEG